MKLRGVNLGGWLLLEKWITPSLFAGLSAKDEYSYCIETASTKFARLKQHRDSFITKDDFAWLADNNINSVRIPIGYWALKDEVPYINCVKYLDKAFEWAAEYNLKIIIDLHGAPGSQNGLDHSGILGPIEWTKGSNIDHTISTITQLSKRYGTQQTLWGIELLNEPGWKVPLKTLRNYFVAGYSAVRSNCDENIAVIISDSFRPLKWNNFMIGLSYQNVILDSHLYQAFTAKDKAMDIEAHIDKTYKEWGHTLGQIDKQVIIGEWSLGLGPNTFADMDSKQENAATIAYASAQMEVFNKTAGWFFWTYKTEDKSGWNYRYCKETGLIA